MSSPSSQSMTWASCLTPPGAAALATLALHGPDAWTIARRLFHPFSKSNRPLPEQPEAGQFWVGRWGQDLANDIVLAVKAVEPVLSLELHSHGGREVMRLLLETLQQSGASLCDWADLVRKTAKDSLQAAATIALAEAKTPRTAAILLDQYQGAFARALDTLLTALDQPDVAEANRLLTELALHSNLGRHLISGWRVVIAGAPNVGKSSLVNALAGFQRSIVSAIPGTTRDVVTTCIAVDGWLVELADTAGVREGPAALEEQGIQRAHSAAASGDLCLWLLDGASPPVDAPHDWPADQLRRVINKVDLSPGWDWDQAADALRISARTGAGLAELSHALACWLVPAPPAPGAAVPFTPQLSDGIEEAQRFLLHGDTEKGRDILKGIREK